MNRSKITRVFGAAAWSGEPVMSGFTQTKARMHGSKVAHATEDAAKEHRRYLIAQGAPPRAVTVYDCRHDETGTKIHFHVGHVTGHRARRQRGRRR